MEETERRPENIALGVLLERSGIDRKELARRVGVHPNTISAYIKGRPPLERPRLEELAGHLGFSPWQVAETLALIEKTEPGRGGAPGGLPAIAAEAGRAMEWFLGKLGSLCSLPAWAEAERAEARSQWAVLKKYSAEERRLAVRKLREYRNWALAELLCGESIQAAADDAKVALELAELALLIAEQAPGEDVWRWRLQGFAWAHVANAKRVLGKLREADWAFARAKELWQAGAVGPWAGVLDEARILGLEASLRNVQRRLVEALRLLDLALEARPTGRSAARHLVSKANVLNLQGLYESALATLHQVLPILATVDDRRLVCTQRFAVVDNLLHLDRASEAEARLPELRRLTAELGKALDGVRLRWLEGRGAAGLGRRQEAIVALAWVRQEFLQRDNGYDTALVTLELAVLYLEEGRSAEVKILAREMEPIFKAEGVDPEALAALRLFTAAVAQEEITASWARGLVRYLYRVQGDPGLRFEPAAWTGGARAW